MKFPGQLVIANGTIIFSRKDGSQWRSKAASYPSRSKASV